MDFDELLSIDTDEDYGQSDAHRRNIERMRREKERQRQKRARMKKVVPIAMAIATVLIISVVGIIVGITSMVKNHKEQKDNITDDQQQVIEEQMPATEDYQEETAETKYEYNGMVEVKVPKPEMQEGYSVDATGATSNISEEDVQSQYATLVNATTGKVIVSRSGQTRMYPASMTKVMTVLVACENITDLNKQCEILIEDTDYAYKNDLSIAGFEEGEIVPLKDILYGAIMPSGGECCHALERIVAGDEDTFIQMMNDKAKELGLAETHYTNSAGLYDENHYTTAVDMAMVMKAAIENELCRQVLYEHIYTTTATENHPEGIELSNWFQRRIEDKYSTTEVLGAKTGYVTQSGNCAASYTVDDNGDVIICVTGNAHSAWRAIFDHVALYNKYITNKEL